jgi:hypothetical protein
VKRKLSREVPDKPDEVLEEMYAVTGVKELLKAIDKVGDILRLDTVESLDEDDIRQQWWSGTRIIEKAAAELQSRLSEHFVILNNIPHSVASALRSAKGDQTWQDFFAGLGIRERELVPVCRTRQEARSSAPERKTA